MIGGGTENTIRPRGAQAWFWAMMLVALLIRLPGLNRPLLGNFATKNVAYAMIARNWARGHAPVTLPTLDVVKGGQKGLHLLEIPVSGYVAGGLWRFLGGSLDFWGRLVSVACSVGAVGWLFALVRRWHGDAAALAAGWAMALSPVAIIYGQSFMLEASVVLLSVAALDAADRFARGGRQSWLVASGLAFCLLVLTKIYMLVLLLPLVWLAWLGGESPSRGALIGGRERIRRAAWGLVCWGCAALPALAWYWHVMELTAPQSPLANRVFYSLRDSQQVHGWPPVLLGQADFYRRLLDDASTLLLTPIGLTLLLVGACRREAGMQLPWLAAMLVLLLALPGKFYAMNYYLLVVLPPLAVLLGLGWKSLGERGLGRHLAAVLWLAGLVFALRYAAKPAFVTPGEDRSVLAAAAACRQIVPVDQPLATLHGTTFDLLYYCDRRGWVAPADSRRLTAALPEMHRQGARYLAVANLAGLSAETRAVLGNLEVTAAGENFALYRLPEQSDSDGRAD